MKQPFQREHIAVTGIVQGVGFRPFVYNLATTHHLTGWVLNSPDGVAIEVDGSPEAIDTFVRDLTDKAPPLSRIVDVERKTISTGRDRSTPYYPSFEIRESRHEGEPVTLIPPDTSVCGDCLSELFDQNDRRYLYPFINCTNCGPRFTIIRDLPYDRPFTTMSSFTMCPDCAAEYGDPADRRFHAQPNACDICGPHLTLLDSDGIPMPGDPIQEAVRILQNGGILAVKGLGGFHLAVDGTSEEAVRRLRQRKRREEKPLALMVGTIEAAKRLIEAGPVEQQVLTGIERPILLGNRFPDAPIAPSAAPDNPYIGVMLPYTPLHYLMFFHPEAGGDYASGKAVFSALVMTSGNISEEPIAKDNDEAVERLHGIADAFLVHDRPIHVRSDDSVVRVVNGEASFIRRSRGYVPSPVFLPKKVPVVLALGAELKNTMCITQGRRAFTSQHIGDLENITTLDFYREAVEHFRKILELDPRLFAYDLHPGYLSTQYFLQRQADMERTGESYGAAGVQHHHAHIASVLAEHGHDSPVIGFSMDGTGFGPDGTIWGGEILLATPYSFTRAAHVKTVALPGGEKAVREPWRMAFSWLLATYGETNSLPDIPSLGHVSKAELDILARACENGVNCPKNTSLGRLFDAVASLLDIRHISTFEGQAAIMLDLAAAFASDSGKILPYAICETQPDTHADRYPALHGTLSGTAVPPAPETDTVYVLDYTGTVKALVEGFHAGESQSSLAADFHETLLASFLDVLGTIRGKTGITTVAYSGGCWQNRFLSERFPLELERAGYTVLTNRLVPPNDGGLALGQAYITAKIAECAEQT